MIESTQVYRAWAKAIGHKRMASTLAVSLQHSYVLTTDPIARDIQVRDDIERITNMVEASAAHGAAGKAANIQAELYFSDLFGRVNRNESPTPLTCESVILRAQEGCAHFSDVLRSCKPGFIPDEVAKEAAEMIVWLREFVACAEASDDVPQTKPIRVAR